MDQLASLKRPRKATEKDLHRESSKKSGTRVKASTPSADISLLPSVAMSEHDKASQITLDKDQLVCYGGLVRA